MPAIVITISFSNSFYKILLLRSMYCRKTWYIVSVKRLGSALSHRRRRGDAQCIDARMRVPKPTVHSSAVSGFYVCWKLVFAMTSKSDDKDGRLSFENYKKLTIIERFIIIIVSNLSNSCKSQAYYTYIYFISSECMYVCIVIWTVSVPLILIFRISYTHLLSVFINNWNWESIHLFIVIKKV